MNDTLRVSAGKCLIFVEGITDFVIAGSFAWATKHRRIFRSRSLRMVRIIEVHHETMMERGSWDLEAATVCLGWDQARC